MRRLKRFWQARLRPLLIFVVGGLLFWALYLLVDYLFTQTSLVEYAVWVQARLDTAVLVMGIFFTGIWGLFVLDSAFGKSNIKKKYSLQAKSRPQPSRIFTSLFVHGSEAHTRGNLPHLLLFAGVAALIVPSGQAFLLATLIIIVVEGVGTWVFGEKGPHLGASGLVLGYYTFIVGFGWFMWTWVITAIAAIIGILFFSSSYKALRSTGNNEVKVSVAGHIFGFLGGLIAAQVVYQLLSDLS